MSRVRRAAALGLSVLATLVGALAGAGTLALGAGSGASVEALPACSQSQVPWRPSLSLGLPFDRGRLVDGVQLPAEGPDHFTWDPILRRSPDRGWRRWAAFDTVDRALRVICKFRRAHPEAPRIGIGDLSRRHGGDFGPRFGGLGHASHQNGLDVDVYYPRLNRVERGVKRPEQADFDLAQPLLKAFVRAGAQFVFVGEHTPLTGRKGVVVPWPNHDDHMHVRFSP